MVLVKTATVTKTATMQQTANICKNSAKNCTCLLEIGKYFSAMGASSYSLGLVLVHNNENFIKSKTGWKFDFENYTFN